MLGIQGTRSGAPDFCTFKESLSQVSSFFYPIQPPMMYYKGKPYNVQCVLNYCVQDIGRLFVL